MSSRERKHTSKEHSRTNKSSSSAGHEMVADKDGKKKSSGKDSSGRRDTSDKKRIASDKDGGDKAKERSEHKLIQHSDEKPRHRRERPDDGRDQVNETVLNDMKRAYNIDKDYEREKRRRADGGGGDKNRHHNDGGGGDKARHHNDGGGGDKNRHRSDNDKRQDRPRDSRERPKDGDDKPRHHNERSRDGKERPRDGQDNDGQADKHHRSDRRDVKDDVKEDERRRRKEKERRTEVAADDGRSHRSSDQRSSGHHKDASGHHKDASGHHKDASDRDRLTQMRPNGDTGAVDARPSHKVAILREPVDAPSVAQLSTKSSEAAQLVVADDNELDDYDVDDDFEDEDDDIAGDDDQQRHQDEPAAPASTGSSSASSSRRSSLQQSARPPITTVMPVGPNGGPPSQPARTQLGHGSFINFRLAQQRFSCDSVANKMLARAFDLSRLIEMDRVVYDIIEMAPVLEHGQYMRMIGRDGVQHEASQTRDDNVERESQTELIEERVIWTQCPPIDDGAGAGCGDAGGNAGGDIGTVSTGDSALTTLSDIPVASLMHVLSVFERLLDEEAVLEMGTGNQLSHRQGQRPMAIGSGYRSYAVSSVSDTSGYCTMARFAPGNSNIFVAVTAAGASNGAGDDTVSSTPLTVWKVAGGGGDKPLLHLICPFSRDAHSDISAVAFSPDSAASHVICGLASGAIALWDLRERAATAGRGHSLSPAYLTSFSSNGQTGDGGIDDCHEGPIVALQSVAAATATGSHASSSYQLISLDALAQLLIWAVSAVSTASIGQYSLASDSVTDLNLRPGARYRLTLVASLSLVSVDRVVSSISAHGAGVLVTSMAVDPARSASVLVGTISGQVMQHERTANPARSSHAKEHSQQRPQRPQCHPKKILGDTDSFECGAVTQLDFYPFFEPYVLAGYNDGLIRIFDTGTSKTLLSFCYKQNNPILQLRWSRSHPAVFLSLDADGNLCVWNVLVNVYQPVHVEPLQGYIGFDLSSDSRWQIKDRNSTNNKARLLLWALDGRLEVHDLADAFSNPELDASFRTCSLFQSLI